MNAVAKIFKEKYNNLAPKVKGIFNMYFGLLIIHDLGKKTYWEMKPSEDR